MIEINTPRDVQEAVRSIDVRALERTIEECLDTQRTGSGLRAYRLDSCGPFVATKLRAFEAALKDHAGAKAAKKLAETGSRARRAGSDLAHAIQWVQHRLETEAKEGQLFFIDDQIVPPGRFDERLRVPVSYRWRPSIEAEWVHGRITFTHVYDPKPDYSVPPPKRKPSAGQLERDRQDELWRQWEQLRDGGLHSLAEYLREGQDGAAIPKEFQARVDNYDRSLNNFSCRFW